MVALFVGGQKVGTLADAEQLIPVLIGEGKVVEFREETGGRRLGTLTPEAAEPFCPWEPTLTLEEARKRITEPGGMTLAEFRKRLGKA
ncbi:hypothetical protein [Gemmata sp.]|uniref:hypothetical protein n=1 Tax=Gemmata sp. TaxID=1914242 RepID=UPI003F70075B